MGKDGPNLRGRKAPAFSLPSDGGGTVSLKDFKGRNLVLYFYPKADTPGCTKEAIAFSQAARRFAKAGTEILGVSADPVTAQDKFKSKHKLTIALGSDETKKMLDSLWRLGREIDVRAQIHGRRPQDLPDRCDGRIARIWPKVTVRAMPKRYLQPPRALSRRNPCKL